MMNIADPLMAREQNTLGEPTMKTLVHSGTIEERDSSEHDELNGRQADHHNTEPYISRQTFDSKSGIKRNIHGSVLDYFFSPNWIIVIYHFFIFNFQPLL